ncbi:SNF2 family DNA-dependent ATPase [Lentinula aciculospora]|uniref:Chromatin-remodeling ATPase INO80 n=1 Tax=Lentinula aciculospora TaxID=153920 RepID=A0A9W9AMF5_9AGAR|nr:SNF2 family DNA-dependent ATPase [Lentinula aciculospora]
MSLSRILNDDPSPALSARSSFASSSRSISAAAGHADVSSASSVMPAPPLRPFLHRSHSEAFGGPGPSSASSHSENEKWEPYSHTAQWIYDPNGPPPTHVPFDSPQNGHDRGAPLHPISPIERLPPPPPPPVPKEGKNEGPAAKKRRKGTKNDADSTPTNGQRRSSRKSQRSAQAQPEVDATSQGFVPTNDERPGTSRQDEQASVSSDLEDCKEVWRDELDHYMLESRKRYQRVENLFHASLKERTSLTAQRMSHYYSGKIARLPQIPSSPPPPMALPHFDEYSYPPDPRDDDSLGYDAPYMDEPFQEYELDVPAPLSPQHPARAISKGRAGEKRPAAQMIADRVEEFGLPASSTKHAPKRRKLESGAIDVVADEEQLIDSEVPRLHPIPPSVKLVRGKLVPFTARDTSLDIIPSGKASRKKPGSKKKVPIAPELIPEVPSVPPSVAGDITPNVSRAATPMPVNHGIIYEMDEVIPPLKKAKKMDDTAALKRVKALEDAQRKVWTNIARRDVVKVYKYHSTGHQARVAQSERIAKLASLQARRPYTKTAKTAKEVQGKAKRLMREMQVFWKKNEREERDVRKREQKEAMDRLKIEEERREAARQARKLEFLISQTELYSHFVGNKLKIQGDEDSAAQTPAGAEIADAGPNDLKDINFDDEDQTNLYRHARHNAQEAIELARNRAQQFDAQAALERKNNEAMKLAKEQDRHNSELANDAGPSTEAQSSEQKNDDIPLDLDSDELNFQNPTSLSGQLTISQPKMLMAQLKEYQLKGLNWLGTLYEQGINGILADEMGLGKTVQSISLLAYLAETHDIWGPFLVVAPASTLHNWQQEITRFVPGLKALPYWGNVKDRTTLRKFWSKKEISYNQDAPFHVLITSYQLVTQDQQYFQRVKWQYMILDEAQNIKNSSSVRWKTLLGFHCRNRLLLTGTPIQNSMQELWALLHFIMPSLFDSHDEFNEWFSKDIENAAENKGSKLNEHQLRRLHMILKPFMLRRVKRHVQNELSEKIEIDMYVDLSARQRKLYRALLSNVSVADLLEKAANIGDADSARSLMNLVMQFRKVCNHPELFERADVVSPFSFARCAQSGPLNREGDFIVFPYSTRNPIQLTLPKLLYEDGGIINVPNEDSTFISRSGCLSQLMSIWRTDYIHKSLSEEKSSSFSFLRLIDTSPQEAHELHLAPLIRRRLLSTQAERKFLERTPYLNADFAAYSAQSPMKFTILPSLVNLNVAERMPDLRSISISSWQDSCLSRPLLKWSIPPAVAPPILMHCQNRTFVDSQSRVFEGPVDSLALYGLPPSLQDSQEAYARFQLQNPGVPSLGLLAASPSDQIPLSKMQVPEAKRLIYDSAKLARLDTLLQELKANDHRVLVYFQMTRMMDLMEEYLVYRQYKYLRLDGSSKIEDRRDMVIDWQTRPDIFVFLLSTRAGGLGINLTAADTVIFYDHDWNPSNDAQAMDRAHRLGQTRQVTVYRLITRGTIDERIVQLARVKKDVQDIVVGSKNFTDVAKPSEIVQLLLNDEQLASLDTSDSQRGANGKGKGVADSRDLWLEEGDEFFAGPQSTAAGAAGNEVAEDENGESKQKRKKPGPKPGNRRKAPVKNSKPSTDVPTPVEEV